jgi:hypothetical protein
MERIVIEVRDSSIAEKVIRYLKKISGVSIVQYKKKKTRLSKIDENLLKMMLDNKDDLAPKKEIKKILNI